MAVRQFVPGSIRTTGIIATDFRPFDADFRIVPRKAALIIGVVKIITLVAEFGHIRKNKETMCESTRNQILFPIILCENLAVILSVSSNNILIVVPYKTSFIISTIEILTHIIEFHYIK